LDFPVEGPKFFPTFSHKGVFVLIIRVYIIDMTNDKNNDDVQVIKVNDTLELHKYGIKNMMLAIACAELNLKGVYTCTWKGRKTRIELIK
jgi:hypothetical protein